MGLNFSKQFLPIILLILLILVWTSVWSLFKIAIEAIPPLSFRVIIGIPAFALLLFLGFKKVNQIVEVEDTPSNRGMINKISDMLEIVES